MKRNQSDDKSLKAQNIFIHLLAGTQRCFNVHLTLYRRCFDVLCRFCKYVTCKRKEFPGEEESYRKRKTRKNKTGFTCNSDLVVSACSLVSKVTNATGCEKGKESKYGQSKA